MLDPERLRTVLAVDACLTVVAGLCVYARPALLKRLLPETSVLSPLEEPATARTVGLLVAAFGTVKGLGYALLLSRRGAATPEDAG